MKQKQTISQKMGMKLSPIQMQIIKLIEMPIMNLQQDIEEKLFENPALEKDDDDFLQNDSTYDKDDLTENEHDAYEDFMEKKEKKDLVDEAYYSDEDIEESTRELGGNPTLKLYHEGEKRFEPIAAAEISLQELLMKQLAENVLSANEKIIATYIIGNIDDSGFLFMDNQTIMNDLLITYNIKTSHNEIERILVEIIQEFDPIGVGARNLQEYLLIQLKHKKDTEVNRIAMEILTHYFEEYSNKHYTKIMQRLSIDKNILQNVIHIIEKIPPRPATPESYMTVASNTIVPDFIVENEDNQLYLLINNEFLPKLRINPLFEYQYQLIQDKRKKNSLSKDEAYIKENVDEAYQYIGILRQREETLFNTLSTILHIQKEYFLTGNEIDLKPMILQDVASKIEMDVSTVSRVTNGKYVQTFFGTIPIKSLFSEAVGDEQTSSREIKSILKKIIANENNKKPFTDEQLSALLEEKGYQLARRTVAKYREELKIPVARLRKKL